jgi:hypothetical protein
MDLLQFWIGQFIAATLIDFDFEVDVLAFLEKPDNSLRAGELQPEALGQQRTWRQLVWCSAHQWRVTVGFTTA